MRYTPSSQGSFHISHISGESVVIRNLGSGGVEVVQRTHISYFVYPVLTLEFQPANTRVAILSLVGQYFG